jgi:hypothetical protein
MNLTVIELIQLGMSSGVMAGGVGVLRWAFQVEKRLVKIETLQGAGK